MERWEDPIVEEVRAVREAYAKRFDYDVQAICRDLRRRQDEDEREIVHPAVKEGSMEAGESG